jgi:hypothetical protein
LTVVLIVIVVVGSPSLCGRIRRFPRSDATAGNIRTRAAAADRLGNRLKRHRDRFE